MCWPREVAVAERVGPKSSRVWVRSMPMPSTAQSRAPSPWKESSVRMPQSFLPSSSTSLTHLMEKERPVSPSRARHTATAAQGVRRLSNSMDAAWGRSRTER